MPDPVAGEIRLDDPYGIGPDGAYYGAFTVTIPGLPVPDRPGAGPFSYFQYVGLFSDGTHHSWFFAEPADADPSHFYSDLTRTGPMLPPSGWFVFSRNDDPRVDSYWADFDTGLNTHDLSLTFAVDAGSDPDWWRPFPAPTVTAISPPSAVVGETVVVTGTNFDHNSTGATDDYITFDDGASGEVYADTLTVDSDTQITVVIPEGATGAFLRVYTDGGSVDGDFAVITPPPSGCAAVYEVHVTDPATSFNTKLDNAVPQPHTEEVSGEGAFSFVMGLYDTQAALCDPELGREFILYRDGTVIGRGPILVDDVDAGGHTVTFHCANAEAYLAGRNLDRGAGRVNLLDNPEFEADADGTRPPTSWAESGITSEVDDAQHVLGTKSVMLTQASPGVDTFLYQTFTHTATPIGDVITVAAWFKIDDASWVGPALEQWGLVVKQTDGGSTVYDFQASLIDSDTPRDQWLRAEVTTWIPPGQTRDIEVHLYGPAVTIWWDATSATLMESFSLLATDQADIANAIVAFLQNTTYGKSDLHIDLDCPATGVIRDYTAQFADHIAGDSALRDFAKQDNGFDYNITPADRTFRTYYPRRGTDRTADVTLVGDVNCIVKRRTFDIRQGASDVVQLGAGDGPDREEGGASDSGAFGGVTWQKILPAKGNPPIDSLRTTAVRELAIAKVPVLYEAVITDCDLVELLELGDTVASDFDHGYIAETRDLRIIAKTRDPKTDTLTLGLNLA